MQLLQFNRRISELRDRDLDVVNRVCEIIERLTNIVYYFAELVATLLAQRIRAQRADRRLQLVNAPV